METSHTTTREKNSTIEKVESRANHEDGFVLVEILSALLVLSIAAISFLSITRDAASFAARADMQFESYQLAKQLVEIERQKFRPDVREETGGRDDSSLLWEVSVQEFNPDASVDVEQPKLIQLKVTVTASDGARIKPTYFSTLLIYPSEF